MQISIKRKIALLVAIGLALSSCGPTAQSKPDDKMPTETKMPEAKPNGIPFNAAKETPEIQRLTTQADPVEKSPIQERKLLFRQPVELYWNDWFGTLIRKDEGETIVLVESEGKTSEFNGILSHNCSASDKYFWKSASDYGNAIDLSVDDAVNIPKEVVNKVFEDFCG